MRRRSFSLFCFLALVFACLLQSQAEASISGPLIKRFSSLLRWTTSSSSKPTQSEGNVLQFEHGYLVETIVEGNALGVVPYFIRISQDGELFAVDADNHNIVKITPPLSQYSRARLVAGSFQGKTGHVDGKPSDARFSSPKGVTMDDKGNVYVADTANLAIRKIGETGVTTIAGGKSNIAGYRDGPSEEAQFSVDFDVMYIRPTCSLLVIDRGNAALRQISLNQEDCDYNSSSVSMSDIVMVIGAILVGYISCLFQQGLSPSCPGVMKPLETGFQEQPRMEKPTPIVESVKEEPVAGWPSFGQLVSDLSKSAMEAVGNIFLQFIPSRIRPEASSKGLTPLKDSLKMPEDEQAKLQSAKKHTAPAPVSEARQAYPAKTSENYAETKPQKMRSASSKDPSMPNKHRSSKRQEFAEFYGSGETPPYSSQVRSKSHKERSKHRHREKSGEVVFRAFAQEPKPVDTRTVNYEDPKFDPYNFRAKYASENPYRF
ncbi:hypothetical protein V2J09_009109 [Rumex salicifolius]